MSEEKEFCGRQIIMELKIACILNIEDFDNLKEKIIKIIKKRPLNYNPEYIENKINDEGQFTFCNYNGHGYFKGKYSEYTKITPEQKRFLNTEVAAVRSAFFAEFTSSQLKEMDEIYIPLHQEIEKVFNKSPTFTELLNDSYLQYKLNGN